MELNFNELRELVATFSQSDVAELTLKSSDFELILRKQGAVALSTSPPVAMVAAPEVVSAPVVSAATPVADAVSVPAAPVAPSSKGTDLLEITSPMVGTFYRSPAPEEPPFVSVGARIAAGQTVCIIEAMKLMNELEAEVAGEIVEILVENAAPVEFGQTLMLVKPA